MTEAAAAPPKLAKRRWWAALLLFVVAASGYLYVGRPTKYFAFLGLYAALILMMFVLPGALLSQPVVFIGIFAFALAVAIYIIVDLIGLSRRQTNYELRWYNRWWIYLGSFLIAMALSFLPELLGGQANQSVRTFSIPSLSGMPALQAGDIIVVNNHAYRRAKPQRGDVVVFTVPQRKNVHWIKRVVGLPGDRIQMKNGQLYINGTAVKRTPAGRFERKGQKPLDQYREELPGGRTYITLDAGQSVADNSPVFTVPVGHYFVMGDNRDNSSDSRFAQIGPVPSDHISGRATGIIFALSFGRIGGSL
ncbi:MAG: signal peptidase I [Pseudomonadota bacterium]